MFHYLCDRPVYVFEPLLTNSFLSCGYMRLLEFIQKSVYAEGFDGANPQVCVLPSLL
jgi:hypothetical protein